MQPDIEEEAVAPPVPGEFANNIHCTMADRPGDAGRPAQSTWWYFACFPHCY